MTRDYLASGAADIVLVMADASQLERSLYMLADFVAACPEQPCLLALNLMDVAENQGKRIDAVLIARRLGVPVVPLVASRPEGYGALLDALARTVRERSVVDGARLREGIAAAPDTIQGTAAAKFGSSPGSRGCSTERWRRPRARTRFRASIAWSRARAGRSPSPSA